MSAYPLRVERLSIADSEGRVRLREVTLSLKPGESVAILGSSGAGKSTLARALLGELDADSHYAAGTILCCGCAVHCASPKRLALLRATATAWLGQDPRAELTPSMRVGQLLAELAASEQHRIPQLLRAMDLPQDRAFLRAFPHQLSGGQCRRVAMIRVLLKQPRLLILDEPFAGLDQDNVLKMWRVLHDLRHTQGCALVVISHDLTGLRQWSSHTLVLHAGRQVEYGLTHRLCDHPQSALLRQWLQGDAVAAPRHGYTATPPLLQVENLVLGRAEKRLLLPPLSFQLHAGECLALSGASGMGKSTLVRTLLGLEPPVSGLIRLNNTVLAPRVAQRQRGEQRALGWVPQDPSGSLNPFRRVGAQLRQASERATSRPLLSMVQWLARVGLTRDALDRLPNQLSGGEQQRVALARALAGRPQILICDEVTSALDVVTSRQMLRLLEQLCHEEGLALLLITHDVVAANAICPRRLELTPQAGITPSLTSEPGDAADDGYHRPFETRH